MALDFPGSPTHGQTYGNYTYDGYVGIWRSSSAGNGVVNTTTSAPTTATPGDLWFNPNDGTMYVYYNDGTSSQWVESRAPITADGYQSPNYIINGGMDIWQRGAGPWNTTNAYTADRWQLNSTINAVRSTDTPNSNFLYSLEYSNTGVQSWCSIRQLIEASNAKHLVGKKVTISFWVKRVSTGGSSMVVEMGHASSTDNFSTITGLPTLTSPVAPSSSWQYMSVTSDVLPAGVANGLYVGFTLANPTNVQMNVRLAGVQLEEGSVATPFRRNANSIQGELAACQRYYQRVTAVAANAHYAMGYAISTGTIRFLMPHVVPLRVATQSIDANNLIIGDGVTGYTVYSVTLGFAGTNQTVIAATTSGITQYRTYMLIDNSGNGTSYIGLNAEL